MSSLSSTDFQDSQESVSKGIKECIWYPGKNHHGKSLLDFS